eukprot:jgi/Phyca11/569447/estExt2_Genewise1.C_PHYCAscaffold_320358
MTSATECFTNSRQKKMTVILCVDGFQKLMNDGTKTCAFYRVMSSIFGFVNSSTAFSVCACSSTIAKPVMKVLSVSVQKCLYLVPPALCGEKVLETRTPTMKVLVGDMGGHGRALEALDSVLRKLNVGEEEIDPCYVVDMVNRKLQHEYPGLFDSRVFKPDTCKELVSAILLQRRYYVSDVIGETNLTVDELRSFGLFRLTSKGCLECAFIFLVELIRKMSKLEGELANFDDHITRSVTAWQPVEYFVGFYRQVKSIAFRNTPLPLSKFHAGARFSNIGGVLITEPSPRELVQALHQHGTKSSSGVSLVTTDQHGDVKVSDMQTIIINGTRASAGNLFMTVELTNFGGQQVKCNEVIQCKFLHTKAKFDEDVYAAEREKAVDDSDVFLLITPSSVDEFDLPPKCGIVSEKEFRQYFGPFASRAFRSILAPPDINKASSEVLRLVKGLSIETV